MALALRFQSIVMRIYVRPFFDFGLEDSLTFLKNTYMDGHLIIIWNPFPFVSLLTVRNNSITPKHHISMIIC